MATLNQYLISVGQEMAAQDNRGTQYVMFAIQVDVKRYVDYSNDWTHKERADSDFGDSDDLCAKCSELASETGELPDDCDDCRTGAFWYYNIEQEFALEPGIFFTAQACQDHIDANHYHYNNPKVYGVAAWRNPELQAVQKHLIKLAKRELPSHYK